MPQSVTHILVPLIVMALIREWYEAKTKKKFPLHYVLIAGLAGALPDFDIAAYFLLQGFGFTLEEVHRTIAHTVFVPLIFVAIFFLIPNRSKKDRLSRKYILLMMAFGAFFHLILDGTLSGHIHPFFPISDYKFGLNLFSYFPDNIERLIPASLDAALLIIWLVYMGLKSKFKNFI